MKFITPIGPKGWARIQKAAIADLNGRTCMHGKCGNRHAAAGPAGELAVGEFFPSFKHADTRDYDFVAPNGLRIEVKTRSGGSPPQKHFDVRVPCYSFEQQQCDIYVFAYAKWNADNTAIESVEAVGWATKERFRVISEVTEVESAQQQHSGFNQRDGSADLRFTQIEKLEPMSNLLEFCVDRTPKSATVYA